MSKRDYRLFLQDIVEAINKIENYTLGLTYHDFQKDDKTIDAVIRNFEIIGEAANQVPESIQEKYPEIEWYKIIGLRNRIIHEYFGVDTEILWKIIKKDLEKLKQGIDSILDRKI